GSDTNPGSMTQPFRTIQKAANVMQPGDLCYVREGTYREMVRPKCSGKPGKSIYFEAYPGENVVVSGADGVTGWQVHQGAIYKSNINWQTEQIFVDGTMMIEARWPNTRSAITYQNYAIAESGTDVQHIYDSHLTEPDGYWDGALLWVYGGAKADVTRVISYSSKTLYFEMTDISRIGREYMPSGHSTTAFDPRPGSRYYLTRGPLSTLDSDMEWWLDRQSLNLYAILPQGADPAGHTVEAKKRGLGFDLSGLSHINIKGFTVFACTVTMKDADNCVVDSCLFRYPSHMVEIDQFPGPASAWEAGRYDTGVILGGHDNQLRNSTVAWSAGNGVTLLPDSYRNTIENCLIHDVNYMGIDCAAVNGHGWGHIIRNNTMFNTGDSVIIHRMLSNSRIEYNHLHSAGIITYDIGITYSGGSDGGGTVIAYNWCHDNPGGSGIYLDNGSCNFDVHHNVVWNVPWSCVHLNMPSEYNDVFNNTLLGGSAISGGGPPGDPTNYVMTGSRVMNNIFVGTIWDGSGGQIGPGGVSQNNIQTSNPMLRDRPSYDFRLMPGSPAIDAGIVIPGITDGYTGAAPDVGAYEGDTLWLAGCKMWDVAAGWSDSTNPASAWGYGLLDGTDSHGNPAVGSKFNLHINSYMPVDAGPWQTAWIRSDLPAHVGVWRSRGYFTYTYDAPPGKFGGHSNYAVQWTAPKAMIVDVDGALWKLIDRDPTLRHLRASLFIKGSLIFDVAIPDRSQGCTSVTPLGLDQAITQDGGTPASLRGISVAAGDTIIVYVYEGSPTGWGDYVGLDLRIIESPGRGGLIGQITDKATGQAIAGASLRLVGYPQTFQAATAADGQFAFNNVPEGTYLLFATRDGYASETTPVCVAQGTATNDLMLDPLGMDVARAAIPSASSGEFSIYNVTDGNPTSGWAPVGGPLGQYIQLNWGSPTTISTILIDTSGPTRDFTVQSSTDGTAWTNIERVTTTESGHSHWLDTIELPSPVTLKHLRLVINTADPIAAGAIWSVECYKPKGTVSGYVKTPAELPIAGAAVYVYESASGRRASSRLCLTGVTDASGQYSIPTPAGQAMVTVAADDSIAVTSGTVAVASGFEAFVPDLIISKRAFGSPAFSNNFDTIANGQADPLLEVVSGAFIGMDGAIGATGGLGRCEATIKGLIARDSVIDVDMLSLAGAGGILARYVDQNNFLLFLYNEHGSLALCDVRDNQWLVNECRNLPIDLKEAHLRVVLAGEKGQAFVSDRWNTYWCEPYTVSNLGTGKIGLYAETGQSAVKFDNLMVTETLLDQNDILSPGSAKSRGSGWSGYVRGVVTAIFPDYSEFILESRDRSGAISVVTGFAGSLGLAIGDEVLVFGIMTEDGRLGVGAGTPDVVRTGDVVDLGALGVKNKDIGPENQHLLLAAWGRVLTNTVTASDGSKLFCITDGSSVRAQPAKLSFFEVFDNFDSGVKNPMWIDYAAQTRVENGRLTATAPIYTAVDPAGFAAQDVNISVDAKSDAAANTMLRFRLVNGRMYFLSTQYVPSWGDNIKRMYFQEMIDNQWVGSQTPMLSNLLLGPDIHISVRLKGQNVHYRLTDGIRTYELDYTVEHSEILQPGSVGLANGGGPTQYFDNFVVTDANEPEGALWICVPPSVATPLVSPGDYVRIVGIKTERNGRPTLVLRRPMEESGPLAKTR
ncbi:MAG: carboxypeptidase regulatory-like domain-containing protein, partial [Armatimonadetes bacterium]|nr:carboxypeptidase regulatory-like domain-containing protein [Armatimonadota bacterium]